MLPVDDLRCVKKVMTELDDLRIGRKRHSCLVVSPPTFEMQDVGSTEIVQSVCEVTEFFAFLILPSSARRLTNYATDPASCSFEFQQMASKMITLVLCFLLS